MSILQRYVAGELLKTFALAAVGLTLVVSLCGAMFATLKAEVVDALEVLRLLWLIEPVVMTLTLPVSGLFACAIVYGRLSADNEFDACRASGINIRRLLAPAVVLSIVLAALTFALTNYVIPGSIAVFSQHVQAGISRLAYQSLKNKGFLRSLDKSKVLRTDRTELKQDEGTDILVAADAAFLDLKDDKLVRCGTARTARVDFIVDPLSSETVLDAVLYDVRGVDFKQHDQPRLLLQRQIPLVYRVRRDLLYQPKFLTLPQLLYYGQHPRELPVFAAAAARLRQQVRNNIFYRKACEALTGPQKELRLDDGRFLFEIRAEKAWIAEEDFRPEMAGVTVVQSWTDEKGKRRQRTHKADAGLLGVGRDYSNTRDEVHLTLRDNVVFFDSLDPGKRIEHSNLELEKVALPPDMVAEADSISDDRMLGIDAVEGKDIRTPEELKAALAQRPLGLGDQIERSRMQLLGSLRRQQYEIRGILHSRLALSASVLATLVLAATLGIVFRNGQLLTAFVISFLPVLVLVLMNMFGRRWTENAGTHTAGLIVIWAGIAVLIIADGLVLVRYLKR